MKIWKGYGSEHSMNLVMIGYFKNSGKAKKTKLIIDRLSEGLEGKIEAGAPRERFSDEVLKLLKEVNFYNFSPTDLEQFLFDTHTRVEGDKIILTTDELEVSAFFKLMVHKGAKVEIFSAHDYPEDEDGQDN